MNIEEYRKRFYTLIESEIGDVKPLISEQPVPKPKKPTPGGGPQVGGGTTTPQVKPQVEPRPIPKPVNGPKPQQPQVTPQTNTNTQTNTQTNTSTQTQQPQETSQTPTQIAKDIIGRIFSDIPTDSISNKSFFYNFPNVGSVEVMFNPRTKGDSIQITNIVLPGQKLFGGQRLEGKTVDVQVDLKTDGSNLSQVMSYLKNEVNKSNNKRLSDIKYQTKDYDITTPKDVPYQGNEVSLD